MQVSVESFGALGRRVKVAVPADEVEKAFSERLARFSRQVKMPGFRPGKVPLKMVEAQYGQSLMQEVAGDLIQTSLQEAIGREGLRPAAGPQIRQESLARGRDLQYTAEFEVYPEITRLDLAGVAIERPVATVADEDVERTLETIRKQRTHWQMVARPAQTGDRLLIDFTGRLDGQPFEGGGATNFPLVLGSGTLIDSLEAGLIGAAAGEVRSVPVKFPDDYRHPLLAGKTAEFEVKVNQVTEPVLPELNAELATQLGIEDGDLAKLRTEIRGNLEREAAQRTRAIARGRVMQALLDANRFEVPQGLIEAEVARLKAEAQARRGPAVDEASYLDRARPRVALGLVLSEIVRRRGLRPDPARVRARLEEMAAEYEKPQEFTQWYYANPERLGEVESLVVEEQVTDALLADAAVTDKPVSFQELLKTAAA
jgi:trigger factor